MYVLNKITSQNAWNYEAIISWEEQNENCTSKDMSFYASFICKSPHCLHLQGPKPIGMKLSDKLGHIHELQTKNIWEFINQSIRNSSKLISVHTKSKCATANLSLSIF